MEPILIFFSVAVVLYVVSALFYIFAFVQKKEHFLRWGLLFALLGFISHTLSLSFYWTRLDNLRFSTFFIINDAAWGGMFVFLLISLFAKFVRPAGVFAVPMTVLLQIWAAVSKKEIGMTPPSFDTVWFWVHVVASAMAYGSFLVAAGIGLLYILKTKNAGDIFYERLPTLKKLDESNYFFVGIGFAMLTLMITSGALWTQLLYGNYWAWDPLEVQSLISWLVYAIWLHLRLTLGWRGIKLAWYALFALPVMIIGIWGIPFVPEVFHRGFRVDHYVK